MLNKNSYIIHLKNIKKKDEELIGKSAFEKELILKDGFKTQPGFVLTSLAFDDFLRSTNLVEPISLLLSEVKPFVKESAESVSDEIISLIQKADFPKIIELPLTEAYKSLSPVLEDSFVKVSASHIIDQKFIPQSSNIKKDNVKGIVQLMDSIKEIWASLFTPEALESRVNEYYHGALTISVLIKKISTGDLSGEFIFNDKNIGEISAIYGIGSVSDYFEQRDIYRVDLSSKKIVETILNPQKKMKIRKGFSKNSSGFFSEIDISEDWQIKQKLNNEIQDSLIDEINKLYSEVNTPFRLFWSVEGGVIFIDDYEYISEYAKETEREKIEKEMIKRPNIIEEKFGKEESEFKRYPISEIEPSETRINLLELSKDDESDNFIESNFKIDGVITGLDITNMSSSKIHSAKFFDISYIDGSKFVEELVDEEHQEKKIEKLYLEIVTAARAALPRTFLYSLSNLKPKKDSGLIFDGDERFIENPEELLIEYIALRNVSAKMHLSSLNFCIPSLRTYNNMRDILRVLHAYPDYFGIKNKVYAEISVPSFLFELTRIDDEVDGFIIDYYKLLKLMMYRNNLRSTDHTILFEIINEVSKVANFKSKELFIKLDKVSDPIIDRIMRMQNIGIIFGSVPPASIISKVD